MTTNATIAAAGAVATPKQRFLDVYEREHATTMRVLRAYPTDQLDLRPHAMCKTARELAWVFVFERRFGTAILNDALAAGGPMAPPPSAPDAWDALLSELERAHQEFGDFVRGIPDQQLLATVKFFTGPKALGDVPRIEVLWSLLFDQIHHRGQFSIYLRMAGARVPSIYGPTADEPWT